MKRADEIFLKANQNLDREEYVNFLSYCYGAMITDVTEDTLDIIEKKLERSLDENHGNG